MTGFEAGVNHAGIIKVVLSIAFVVFFCWALGKSTNKPKTKSGDSTPTVVEQVDDNK